MVSEVRRQLDAKLGSSKPSVMNSSPSLYPDKKEMCKQKMVNKTKEVLDTLRQNNIRASVVVEAEMED